MPETSMHNLFLSNGRFNIFAWILFIVMILAFLLTIIHCWFSISKIFKEEKIKSQKMLELEMNLREIRGNQYKESK